MKQGKHRVICNVSRPERTIKECLAIRLGAIDLQPGVVPSVEPFRKFVHYSMSGFIVESAGRGKKKLLVNVCLDH